MAADWDRPTPERGRDEPIKRLSVNLPESLHTRFKTACSATNRRMIGEVLDFVERRTAELEQKQDCGAAPGRHRGARK